MSGSTTATALLRPTSQIGNRPQRVTLKSEVGSSGHVDGGWWPRSRDLAAELPGLLSELAGPWGRIERVSYNLTVWGPVPRKLVVGNSVVRLAGYRSQHPDTIDVISGRRLITILVVPPEASTELAQRALTAAADPDDVDPIDELLAPRPRRA